MCLVTKQKKARIATRDIICYKQVVSTEPRDLKKVDCVESRFYAFTWYPNQLNATELDCKMETLGWVSYFDPRTKGYLDKIAKGNPNALFNAVGGGFHASLTRRRLEVLCDDYPIGTFVIPRGSEIFTDGANGLIVSNKMMWLGC
jgi:hypothetical protein